MTSQVHAAHHVADSPPDDDNAAAQRAREIADRRARRPLRPKAYYTTLITRSLWGAAAGVPLYFLVLRGYLWPVNPQPPVGWMWMIPGVITIAYLLSNLYWANRAAEADSDDLGMGKDWWAQIAVGSVVITLVIMLILAGIGWWKSMDLYQINLFQILTLMHFIVGLFAVQWLTSWLRRQINRRYFGSPQQGVDG